MTERPTSRWAVPSLVACALLGAACYSEFPLDAAPREHVSSDLLGEWTCRSGASAETANVTVKASDAHRYQVVWQDQGRKAEHLQAFASLIGTHRLFNVAAAPGEDSGWFHPWVFVKANVSAGVLRIQVVGEHVVTGKERSPQEVRKALSRAVTGPDFLGDPILCQRQGYMKESAAQQLSGPRESTRHTSVVRPLSRRCE
jgi:hypothetical protein